MFGTFDGPQDCTTFDPSLFVGVLVKSQDEAQAHSTAWRDVAAANDAAFMFGTHPEQTQPLRAETLPLELWDREAA